MGRGAIKAERGVDTVQLGTPSGTGHPQQQDWQLSKRSSSPGRAPPGCMPPFLSNFSRSLRRRASVVARRPRWMGRSKRVCSGAAAATVKCKAAAIVADVVTALKQEDPGTTHHVADVKVEQAVADVKLLMEGRELCIQLKGARNLVGADWAGISNPYAKVRVGSNEQQTQHIRATLNPRWNNTFLFSQADVATPEAKGLVQIEVWSYESFHPESFLGQAQLDLSTLNLAESRASLLRVPLLVLKPNGKKEHGDFGELFLSVWTMPSTKQAVMPGEDGAPADSSTPQVASMCGGNLHRQLPSLVHAGTGTLYEEPCVVFIKVTLVALERLEALLERGSSSSNGFEVGSAPSWFHRRGAGSGDAGSSSGVFGGARTPLQEQQLRRHTSAVQRRPCFLSQLNLSNASTTATSDQPSSPPAGRSHGFLSHSSSRSQGQAADEAAGQIEGVSARNNVLDEDDHLSSDDFDDSAMDRDSTAESSSLGTDISMSMSAVLERLRGKLQHQESNVSSTATDSDGTGMGPYMYCKVTYAKQSYHTRMLRLHADGSLHLDTCFVFCDVRPLHDRPLEIDVYASHTKKSRGRLVGQLALPLLDLAADCAAAEPGPGVKVAHEDGKGVVQLLAVSRGLEGRAGGTAVVHAGVADADNRAAIYRMDLRADQPPTECKAFMEVAAVVTDSGAAVAVGSAAALAGTAGADPSAGVVVEVPVADVAGVEASAEAGASDQGAGAAVVSALADAAAGAHELLSAMVEEGAADEARATRSALITSAVSASSDGSVLQHVNATVMAEPSATAQQQQAQEQQQQEREGLQEAPSTSLATASSTRSWLRMAKPSGSRTVSLLQAAANRMWREHELPVSGGAPDVGKERVLSTLRCQLHSVELLTHLRGANWCLVGNVGPNWMITKARSPTDSSVFSWEVMAPLYAPDSVLTLALFSVPTGLRVKETPTMLGKVRTIVSGMEPGKDHSFTLLVPAHDAHSSSSGDSCNVASIRATFRVQYCNGWKDMVTAYKRAPRPASFYELGLEEESSQQLEKLRRKIIFRWLEHSQPPIPQAMAESVLESHRDAFSMRRLKTNYQRAIDAFGWVREVGAIYDNICTWQHPARSLAAAVLVVTTAAMPSRMAAALLLFVVVAMLWRYSKREPHREWGSLQYQNSHLDSDEGVDVPLSSIAELKRRYDQVASVALTVQNLMDTLATFSERMSALMSWQDPVASTIFAALIVCGVAAIVVLPGGLRTVVAAVALYLMRPPIIRDALPALPLLLFEKLPSAADVM